MSRLTEKEMDLIRDARLASQQEPAGADHVVQKAQRLQSETFGELLTRGAAAVASWSGLAALAGAVDAVVLQPIAEAFRRRAAVTQLRRLDDHLLRDIGLERGMIESYGEQLSARVAAPSRRAARPATGFGQRLHRRRSIRELEALSDRQLADIGVVRGTIAEVVDQAMAEEDLKARRVSTEAARSLTREVVSATRQAPRRPAEPVAAKPAPILPLWIGPWLAMPHDRNAA